MHDSLSGLSQCIATIITFAQIQIRRHPEISYPIPMLRVDPEGVVVLVYDYPSDVLMISQHIGWSCYAFIAVWLTLHYSLFPSNALSELSDSVEALLTDTLVSGQLYLWTLFSIPLFDLFPLFLMEIIPVSGQLH